MMNDVRAKFSKIERKKRNLFYSDVRPVSWPGMNVSRPAFYSWHIKLDNLAALSHPRSKQVVNERKLCRRVDCRYFCYMITDGNCWRCRVVSWYVHKHPVKSSSDVGILTVFLEVVNNNWHRCGILWGATFILSCICIITSSADVVFTS